MDTYDETEFVLYCLAEMKIPVLAHSGRHVTLANNYRIEVEDRDLYRLTIDGFVISPFNDVGSLCQFIQRNQPDEND